MDVDALIEECFQAFEEAKKSVELYNNLALEYNKKIESLKPHLNDEESENIKQILIPGLNTTSIETLSKPVPIDYQIVDKNDDNIDSEIDTYDEYDEYDEIGDINMNTGSGARYQKGTGQGKYKEVFNTKHVRVSMDKAKK